MACPSKRMWAQHFRIQRSGKPDALNAGTIWHCFLEEWRRTWNEPSAFTAMHLAISEAYPQDMPASVAKVVAAARPYVKVFAGDDQAYEWLSVEERYTLDLGHGILVDCWPDAVVRERDGATWVVESKTVSSGIANRPAHLMRQRFDVQLAASVAAVRDTLGRCDGVIYDELIKSDLRLKKKQTIQEYIEQCMREYEDKVYNFRRTRIQFGESEMAHAKTRMRVTGYEIHGLDSSFEQVRDHLPADKVDAALLDVAKRYPRNSNECVTSYGQCQYLEACYTGKIDREIYEERFSRRDDDVSED